jgi:hypothetical protein
LFLNRTSIPILFADDTSVLVTGSSSMESNKIIDETFHKLNKWFNTNLLSLNFDKTHFIHSKTKNTYTTEITVKNDTLNWTTHLDQLTRNLSASCYAIRVLKHLMPLKTLIMIYYAYFYTLMNYDILFWGVIPLILSIYLDYKKR